MAQSSPFQVQRHSGRPVSRNRLLALALPDVPAQVLPLASVAPPTTVQVSTDYRRDTSEKGTVDQARPFLVTNALNGALRPGQRRGRKANLSTYFAGVKPRGCTLYRMADAFDDWSFEAERRDDGWYFLARRRKDDEAGAHALGPYIDEHDAFDQGYCDFQAWVQEVGALG